MGEVIYGHDFKAKAEKGPKPLSYEQEMNEHYQAVFGVNSIDTDAPPQTLGLGEYQAPDGGDCA